MCQELDLLNVVRFLKLDGDLLGEGAESRGLPNLVGLGEVGDGSVRGLAPAR